MCKVTITPKVPMGSGTFFLDTDREKTYKTYAVTMSNGFLLFWDRERETAVRHKLSFDEYFYDITDYREE